MVATSAARAAAAVRCSFASLWHRASQATTSTENCSGVDSGFGVTFVHHGAPNPPASPNPPGNRPVLVLGSELRDGCGQAGGSGCREPIGGCGEPIGGYGGPDRVGSGLAKQDVGGMLGVGVLADRGDLAVADGEDADVAVVVRGTAAGGGAGGPLGDDLVV